jgi:plastocyanin
MKKNITLLAFVLVLAVIIAACGGGTTSTGASSDTVHMNQMAFLQSSITISKGSSLTLVDDAASLHIIANGSWVNGSTQAMQEPGAPVVNHLQISGSGSSQTIGPFTRAGTYQLFCTIHPGMDLTVVVP